ncbi:MAG: DUF4145 domain-containing protein [Candidatus Woesebacteria bacterium]|nr:DUF4145 domain-containing protein [Candidatus Woesebacteria bacterium]
MKFEKEVLKLKETLDKIETRKIDIQNMRYTSRSYLDYKQSEAGVSQRAIINAIEGMRKHQFELNPLVEHNSLNEAIIAKINDLVNKVFLLHEKKDISGLKLATENLISLVAKLDKPREERKTMHRLNFTKVPEAIKDEIIADYKELENCFKFGAYRSAIILCGRILEAALHRKYYDATTFDILEKSPGIGLGNLIAKLSERGVHLDPGLTQQIHLINNVRIFSVHKKQRTFYPTKVQAEAIILYTLDTIERMF